MRNMSKSESFKRYDAMFEKRERDANLVSATIESAPSRAEGATREALRTLRESTFSHEDKKFYEWILHQNAAVPKILEALGPCLDAAPTLTNLAYTMFKEGTEGRGPTLADLDRLSAAAIESQGAIQRLAALLLEVNKSR